MNKKVAIKTLKTLIKEIDFHPSNLDEYFGKNGKWKSFKNYVILMISDCGKELDNLDINKEEELFKIEYLRHKYLFEILDNNTHLDAIKFLKKEIKKIKKIKGEYI